MNTEDLSTILRDGESERFEFKTSLADSKRILETVAAMATLGGGTIVVGVRDDGEVVGVDLGEGAQEQLSQRIPAGTDPKVIVRRRTERLHDRDVLRIDVPPGDGPHLADGRAFTRTVPATVLMSRDEYERRLLVELAGPRGVVWDGDPTSLLDRLLLLREGRPTVGAVLLFGHDPQRVLNGDG